MGLNLIIKNIFLDLLDFVFPNFCLRCDHKIKRSLYQICDECLDKIPVSSQEEINLFFSMNLLPYGYISNFYSKYVFIKDGLFQYFVHQLKYNGKSKVGILFGKNLGLELQKLNWFKDIDLIVPVPLHKQKKFKRGYNQSSMIVKGIARITNKNFDEKVIKRIKNTETQTHLHLHERIENVKNAFKITKSEKIKDKKILIVDDVCTTGSTVNEIAKTLLIAGAKKVNLATLAFVKEKDFSVQT